MIAMEPGDFVCIAQAGMRLADLNAALEAEPGHRQRLMLDPPHGADATLGGIVATNASGPLRHRYGAPRDLVIGARMVLADGTRAKTGGRVVKNVAGYDLARLLCGSLGLDRRHHRARLPAASGARGDRRRAARDARPRLARRRSPRPSAAPGWRRRWSSWRGPTAA